jgi:hypothetical protein
VRVRTTKRTLVNVTTQWRFSIDSTPPNITFVVEPPRIVLSSSVLMKVSSNEEGTTWECALLQADAKAIDLSLLKRCDILDGGTIQYKDLQDGGVYTFALLATDPPGNKSPVAIRRWRVDATAPKMYGVSIPEATRDTVVHLHFGVSDGPAGTGVKTVNCGVRWLGNTPETQATWAPCRRAQVQSTARRRLAGQNCTTCIWYEHLLLTEDEGVWGFTVKTADNANQAYTSPEASITVDRVGPQASWATAGVPRSPSPSDIVFKLATVDSGPYNSAVTGSLCSLTQLGAVLSDDFNKQSNATVVLDGVGGPGTLTDFQYIATDGSSQPGTFATWHMCNAPAQLSRVPSGMYTFRAKPLDAAGNVGKQLQSPVTVDEHLSRDGSKGNSKRGVKDRTYGIIGGVAAMLLCAVLVIVVVASRRRSAHRRTATEGVTAEVQRRAALAHDTMFQGSDNSRDASHILAQHPMRDQVRIDRALELSMIEAGIQASRSQQREEQEMKLAIEASLVSN